MSSTALHGESGKRIKMALLAQDMELMNHYVIAVPPALRMTIQRIATSAFPYEIRQ